MLVLALAAGGGAALVVPAVGQTADHAVTAADFQFSPATTTIAVGDSVTWSYPTGISMHNVHFTDAGDTFPDQPATPSAPGWTVKRTFTQAGTYHYQCALHSFMTGTIVVGDGGTAGTTTTTPTYPTYPTYPTTATTPAAPASADARAPRATHVRVLRGRLRLTLSERARLKGTLTRGAHRVARLSRALPRGATSLRLPAHLEAGRYRVRFTLTDAAGNTSAARTVGFTVR